MGGKKKPQQYNSVLVICAAAQKAVGFCELGKEMRGRDSKPNLQKGETNATHPRRPLREGPQNTKGFDNCGVDRFDKICLFFVLEGSEMGRWGGGGLALKFHSSGTKLTTKIFNRVSEENEQAHVYPCEYTHTYKHDHQVLPEYPL